MSLLPQRLCASREHGRWLSYVGVLSSPKYSLLSPPYFSPHFSTTTLLHPSRSHHWATKKQPSDTSSKEDSKKPQDIS